MKLQAVFKNLYEEVTNTKQRSGVTSCTKAHTINMRGSDYRLLRQKM